MGLKQKLLKIPLLREWKRASNKRKFTGSAEYWEERYSKEGNSGGGSYNQLAEFKAEFLNDFVKRNGIESVIEFGSGDGNQLMIAEYPNYIGLDVSVTAIKGCIEKFSGDRTKSFYLYNSFAFCDNARIFYCQLSLSLDVLYHLVEIEIFENYIKHLFDASQKYVIIYATDYNQEKEPVYQHEHRRRFTDYIEKNISNWHLKEIVKNKFPVEKYGLNGSDCSFFVYEKNQ